MSYYIMDIDWDTADPNFDEDADYLPDEVWLPEKFVPYAEKDNIVAVEDEIADFLSDQYGCLVNSFVVEREQERG